MKTEYLGNRSAQPCSPPRVLRSWRILWVSPIVLATAVTALGAVLWLVLCRRMGTDMSAQSARAALAGIYPRSAYFFNWYGGIYPAGYALLTPYLLAVVGVRLASAVAAVLCAALLALLLARHDVPRPRAAVLWSAAALWSGLLAGETAFLLGLAAALASVVLIDAAWLRSSVRLPAVALLALLSSALSPVTGLFLGVAAVACFFTGRRIEGLLASIAAAVPLAVAALLSNGGVQPINVRSGVTTVLSALFVLSLVPRRWRAVRVATVIYGIGVIIAWAAPTPIGSNVERLSLYLAGPVVVALAAGRSRRTLAFALIGMAGWQVGAPILVIAHGNSPLAHSSDTRALRRELELLHADTARVEAVPQYGHWESQDLASIVPLARGWERQIDMERNPMFYHGLLTPEKYHSWLRDNAVAYVAVATGSTDYAAVQEARIVRSGQPWLIPVWQDSQWTLDSVQGSQPMAGPPGAVISTTPADVTIRMPASGSIIVRVRWSHLLTITGDATMTRSDNWTRLTADRPGTYVLSARY